MTDFINISQIKKVYFIGVGGIGMSAIARFFKARGVLVAGYDKTATALTDQLIKEGILVNFVDDPSLCTTDFDAIVYTPAIPSDNLILNHCRSHGMNLMKRSDMLQIISRDTFNICIAGTHGKTTISTMVAHILRHTEYGCNAFLGGISSNYNTNFWSNPRPVCVIEADEYDRSFLKLHPNIIAITAMDADHLDIYGTAYEVEESFLAFTRNLKESGLLISKKGIQREAELSAANHFTYHLENKNADIHAANLEIVNGAYRYDVIGKDWQLKSVKLNMGGLHNVENTLVAIAIAKHLGIEEAKIKSAIEDFKGVKRRFDFIVNSDDQVYIDDYAHHPEELRALITGVRSLYPHEKLTILFQPHLFTRTRDFAEGFAESLDLADEVLLLPIYAARELPIEGVDSSLISRRMNAKVSLVEKDEVVQLLSTRTQKLFVTAGAGDIDKLIDPLKNALISKS
jgi:UDP-N-acetylmuramate--alanine ligase